jgi:hypothetical protein
LAFACNILISVDEKMRMKASRGSHSGTRGDRGRALGSSMVSFSCKDSSATAPVPPLNLTVIRIVHRNQGQCTGCSGSAHVIAVYSNAADIIVYRILSYTSARALSIGLLTCLKPEMQRPDLITQYRTAREVSARVDGRPSGSLSARQSRLS